MLPSLLVGTVAGSASHLSLAYLAAHGGDGGTAFWAAIEGTGFTWFFVGASLIGRRDLLEQFQPFPAHEVHRLFRSAAKASKPNLLPPLNRAVSSISYFANPAPEHFNRVLPQR
jgi:hypothetical protein